MTLVYTKTDEAPALATCSLLPIIKVFAAPAGIEVETKDISLAGRIIASFPEHLTESQRQPDDLAALGELAKTPVANIIKLPNISASVPQLTAAIAELQGKGYGVPDYVEDPKTRAEQKIKARYAKILGSAVNPVLREGNSDRRVATAVKEYAKNNPHPMGDWHSDSKSHVAYMRDGDFYSSEQSAVIAEAGTLKIEFVAGDGKATVLKEDIPVAAGEIVDAAVMDCRALRAFYEAEIADANAKGVLFSLHLKATMMKVSDPILFGHAVSVYYKAAFEKHAAVFAELGIDPNNGIGEVYEKIKRLPDGQRAEIEADIAARSARRAKLAMVNSDRGITNLHVPSDVIIDASMPTAIRESGRMWGPDGALCDTKFTIPDRCYARVYQEVIAFHKEHGAFDVTAMGNVSNVGLTAQKAEEYGSHDKTFEMAAQGRVRVVDHRGRVLLAHDVGKGDIWRACQTRDLPIRDWVELAVKRARITGAPAIFWLDENRAHDKNVMDKVHAYLDARDTSGLDIRIMSPTKAMRVTLERARDGKDTISVTGNVLRDYLTDLFPILELGTSAKMLSIVPLLAGGSLFETGAAGSAPKHVQQFVAEGHLRWDSLGEFLALAASLEDLGHKTDDERIKILADALNGATREFLNNGKSPSRVVHELDNRGSHFYLALYWAQALAAQDKDADLQARFARLAQQLEANETRIMAELDAAQGSAVDIGGYYFPNEAKMTSAMRPSATFNALLEGETPKRG